MAVDKRCFSLLDKLIVDRVDASPALPAQVWGGPSTTDAHVQSIIQDVTALLNTKRRFLSVPKNLKALQMSLLDYGLPDFSGGDFVPKVNWANLREAIEQTIRKYENRLQNVSVELREPTDAFEHRLCFQISAQLVLNRDAVMFDVGLAEPYGQFQAMEDQG